MDADQDVTRIVRSWLRIDEHESADQVLATVLARVDTTRQRRSWWPTRRITDMNTYAKVLITVAAVVVVAFVGLNLLPANGGVGGAPSPSPSPTPRPATSVPPAAVFPPAGSLAADTTLAMTLSGVPLTLKMPTADWVSNGQWGIDKPGGGVSDGAGFIFWPDHAPIGVFADPCTSKQGPAVGQNAADLAAAVAALPGIELVSGPSDVTVDGRPGKHVEIRIPADITCPPNAFYLWYAPNPDQARYATTVGSTIGVWIIDVDGTLVWIDGETLKGAGPELGTQVQQIIDSIRFG